MQKHSPLTSDFPSAQGLYSPANEHDSCGVGFIAHMKGEPSHQIVTDALEMLRRMDHRGGCGCEAATGDGSGIMTAMPDALFRGLDLGFTLPPKGRYATGNLFLPKDETLRKHAQATIEKVAADVGLISLGWREVPTDAAHAGVGPTALKTEPSAWQPFLTCPDDWSTGPASDFDRALYLLRKIASREILDNEGCEGFYACSLSSAIMVYKGQLTSSQVPQYYNDLCNTNFESHLAMVHSRFSTNTFPSWDRAQPLRWMSHNGEINTNNGNRNWLAARQGQMQSPLFGERLNDVFPVVEAGMSDSGSFDNALELLLLSGRELPHAVMMMIPEAWENHPEISEAKRNFYKFHAFLQEPWDGPASLSFTDGNVIGASLDRNGLRPSRYWVTKDDRVIMASEVGVVDVPPADVAAKGRLQPGKMFLVDFNEGRIIPDEELKKRYIDANPWGEWLDKHALGLENFPEAFANARPYKDGKLIPQLRSFGYTLEHLHFLLKPMLKTGKEALGSMGNDSPLAVLSDQPRLIYDYFKQLFAQVTNPPIDPIREACVMSLGCAVGPSGNPLIADEEDARRLWLESPLLTDSQMASLKGLNSQGAISWRSATLDATFDASNEENSGENLKAALESLADQAEQAARDGTQIIILSDKAVGPARAAIPNLLAVGAVHHRLVQTRLRTAVALMLESGEAREVHHFCLLTGFGADAINPYMAHQALYYLQEIGAVDKNHHLADDQLVHRFFKAVEAGMLKVMSKMGISTLSSYKGAQIFEALGLHQDVVDLCLRGTASRISGANFDTIATESLRRHRLGFGKRQRNHIVGERNQLSNPGEYHWRAGGEPHGWSPQTIANLQTVARKGGRETYQAFAREVQTSDAARGTLRGLLSVKKGEAIPLEEVEPAKNIVKRFRTGAMSLGALSPEAHESLAMAMNEIGGMSNSGEGGEDEVRFTPMTVNGKTVNKRSAIKQIASGRFGVTSHYLCNADVLQIKLAQGAKPGEGGQLPGYKVNDLIARLRHSTPGVGLISPPPHHDIYSIEDLAQLIYDLKNANPEAVISVKLVSEVGVGTIAAGVAKCKADHILISGYDGGTGASPLTSTKHAGLPWELGIAETHQTLMLNGLRDRVRLETDGGMKTGRDVFIAACLGAEEYGFSTAPLIAVGCIMMRKCHLNTCPVGVCTQDPALRKKFKGMPEHVINYLFMVAEECREWMASCGIRSLDELIGRVDLLGTDNLAANWKAENIDLTPILSPAANPYANQMPRKVQQQDHGIERTLDAQWRREAADAIQTGQAITLTADINNLNRSLGTQLSHDISRIHGATGMPDNSVRLHLRGSAGQSLGAFLARGVTLSVDGDANDYVGKGLSGGRIIVRPDANSSFNAEDNIIIGNTALYGATSGEAFFRGIAAERFSVRNSGAHTVVEGVGDHGCEYMTGGRVVVLGPTGRNFAAGMSGGIAYIYDPRGQFEKRCNPSMVELEDLSAEADQHEVRVLIEKHVHWTGSSVGQAILDNWDTCLHDFIKVMPTDYKRVLMEKAQQEAALTSGVGLG